MVLLGKGCLVNARLLDIVESALGPLTCADIAREEVVAKIGDEVFVHKPEFLGERDFPEFQTFLSCRRRFPTMSLQGQ